MTLRKYISYIVEKFNSRSSVAIGFVSRLRTPITVRESTFPNKYINHTYRILRNIWDLFSKYCRAVNTLSYTSIISLQILTGQKLDKNSNKNIY